MTPALRKLLAEFDELGAFEFPSTLDRAALEHSARQVGLEMSTNGIANHFEDWMHNQDASFGLAIVIDTFTVSSEIGIATPTIRFSNFGHLASITFRELVPDSDFHFIIKQLRENGFRFVAADELDVTYDGVNAPKDFLTTWWVRYFDWL